MLNDRNTKEISEALIAGIEAVYLQENTGSEINKLAESLLEMAIALQSNARELTEMNSLKRFAARRQSELLSNIANALQH